MVPEVCAQEHIAICKAVHVAETGMQTSDILISVKAKAFACRALASSMGWYDSNARVLPSSQQLYRSIACRVGFNDKHATFLCACKYAYRSNS